jgi:hypothetical protein
MFPENAAFRPILEQTSALHSVLFYCIYSTWLFCIQISLNVQYELDFYRTYLNIRIFSKDYGTEETKTEALTRNSGIRNLPE